MKKFSVVVRVEYIFEVEAEDAEAAEERARELYQRGSTRLAVGAEIDSVQADEMGPMSDFDEATCLQVDPFAGDFGSPGDKILQNNIVVARKTHECCECLEMIDPGTKNRVIVAIFDGELHHYRYCAKCCAAMAMSEKDHGKAWEARVALRENRERSPT